MVQAGGNVLKHDGGSGEVNYNVHILKRFRGQAGGVSVLRAGQDSYLVSALLRNFCDQRSGLASPQHQKIHWAARVAEPTGGWAGRLVPLLTIVRIVTGGGPHPRSL